MYEYFLNHTNYKIPIWARKTNICLCNVVIYTIFVFICKIFIYILNYKKRILT